MTLFRKVFPNQSQPASEGEIPDEAALRSAFLEADSGSEPLRLDPFEHALQTGKTEDDDIGDTDTQWDEQDADSGFDDPYAFDSEEHTGADSDLEQSEPEAELTDHSDEYPEPLDTDAQDSMPVQSDEEMAACLTRALAANLDADTSDTALEETHVDPESEDYGGTQEAQTDVGTDPNEMSVTSTHQMDAADVTSDPAIVAEDAETHVHEMVPAAGPDPVPAPAVGRAGRRAGRVKTRLLGFNRTGDADMDPLGQAPGATASAQSEKYPVGWLVIVEGPGLGHAFSIFTGASMIGRGEDQIIRLDFGDNSISRDTHATIAYDEEHNKFYIGHGGKSNIIRRNARPVLSTEELLHADLLRIGETTLRFVALCGSDFQWSTAGGAYAAGV